ncbi:hypothetical protein BT93_B2862 [Corymbia citriodora subsp. variegata]|nr:hypothetical protein BT93_B2862 [Corymbia citriodora subsp. variegata]
MISCFGINAFKHSLKGETLLLQTDITRANTISLRSINWSDIVLLEQWELDDQAPPKIFCNRKVTIQFPRRSFDIRSIPSSSSRKSIDLHSNLPPIITLPLRNQDEAIISNLPNNPITATIIGLDNRFEISRPIYQQDQSEQNYENQDSPYHSSTYLQLVDQTKRRFLVLLGRIVKINMS